MNHLVPPTGYPPERRLRVVMLVANAVTVDNRVRRMAATVALAGYHVTVVGLALGDDSPEREVLGPVQILRAQIKYPLRRLTRDVALTESRRPAGSSSSTNSNTAATAASAEAALSRAWLKIDLREAAADVGARRTSAAAVRAEIADGGGLGARWKRVRAMRALRQAEAAYAKKKAALLEDATATQGARVDSPWPQSRQFPPRALIAPTPIRNSRDASRARERWRALTPDLEDIDLAMWPLLTHLDPDIVHAHDVHTIGVASRFLRVARGKGRAVTGIYDAHELVGGLARYADDVLQATVDFEAAHISDFESVVTVSEPLADELIALHRLPRRPVVVRNIPHSVTRAPTAQGTVRTDAGLDRDTPLLVYSGGIDFTRGVEDVIRAVGLMEGVHLAIVMARTNRGAQTILAEEAARVGASERIQFLPFVPGDQVTTYLSGATVGVHTLRTGWANHEVALPNKVFEYLAAGLPMVLSDCAEMARFIREHPDIGATYESGSPESLAQAIDDVLRRTDAARQAVRTLAADPRYRWTGDARSLLREYARALGRRRFRADLPPAFEEKLAQALASGNSVQPSGSVRRPIVNAGQQTPTPTAREPALRIAPANMAGQGYAWAEALNRAAATPGGGVRARSFAIKRGAFDFEAHEVVPATLWTRSAARQAELLASVISQDSHVLNEAGMPLFSGLIGDHFSMETELLDRHGIKHGVVFHGSEIRPPGTHKATARWSQYWDLDRALVQRLEKLSLKNREWLHSYEGKVFVTTPDLLEYVEGATLLPLTLEVPSVGTPDHRDEPWGIDRADTSSLRVGFLPSNPVMKGGAYVNAICNRLASDGVIVFRAPQEPMPFRETWDFVRSVDVIIDGIVSGNYGVTSCQAMLMGRVAVAHVSPFVRDALGEPCPVVEANPATLEGVLRGLAADLEAVHKIGFAGRLYAEKAHAGAAAVQVLTAWIRG